LREGKDPRSQGTHSSLLLSLRQETKKTEAP